MKLSLDELKEKYPLHKIKYEPLESCKFCGGSGERRLHDGSLSACSCLCIHHDHSEWFLETMDKIVRE